MAFVNKWQQFSVGLDIVLKNQYASSMFFTNWPDDIEGILVLLKLLPANKVGRNALAKRDTFYKASERMIVYYQVAIQTFLDKNKLSLNLYVILFYLDRNSPITNEKQGKYTPVHNSLRFNGEQD